MVTRIAGKKNSIVQKLWQWRRFPFQCGIVKDDGLCVEMTVVFNGDATVVPSVVAGNRFHITDILDEGVAEDELRGSSMELFDQCEYCSPSTGMTVVGGGGALGGDGFVALLDENRRLEWIALFDVSNPFVEVKLREGEVFAMTSLDDLWVFTVDAPENVSIQRGDDRGYDIRRNR